MIAWAKATAPRQDRFLADWDASFANATGLAKDLSAGGLGVRSTRFSMLVENGVVKFVEVEEKPGTGNCFVGEAMLERL